MKKASERMDYKMKNHLVKGGQISNGPQSIAFSVETNTGYITCDDPNCCQGEFGGLDGIEEYISPDFDEWVLV